MVTSLVAAPNMRAIRALAILLLPPLRCMAFSPSFDGKPIEPTSIASLPLLPSGSRVTLETRAIVGSGTVGLGGRVWPSAAALCRWLRRNEDCVVDKTVVELGCGTGAVGIFASALGATSVTMTDGGDERLLQLARKNVEANAAVLQSLEAVQVVHYEWGTAVSSLMAQADLVVASDVTYARSEHDKLCQTLRDMLSTSDGGMRILIAHEHRRIRLATSRLRADRDQTASWDSNLESDPNLKHFLESAVRHGLRLGSVDAEAQAKAGLRDISLLEVSPAP